MRIRTQCRECGLPFSADLEPDSASLPCPACSHERKLDWDAGGPDTPRNALRLCRLRLSTPLPAAGRQPESGLSGCNHRHRTHPVDVGPVTVGRRRNRLVAVVSPAGETGLLPLRHRLSRRQANRTAQGVRPPSPRRTQVRQGVGKRRMMGSLQSWAAIASAWSVRSQGKASSSRPK